MIINGMVFLLQNYSLDKFHPSDFLEKLPKIIKNAKSFKRLHSYQEWATIIHDTFIAIPRAFTFKIGFK